MYGISSDGGSGGATSSAAPPPKASPKHSVVLPQIVPAAPTRVAAVRDRDSRGGSAQVALPPISKLHDKAASSLPPIRPADPRKETSQATSSPPNADLEGSTSDWEKEVDGLVDWSKGLDFDDSLDL